MLLRRRGLEEFLQGKKAKMRHSKFRTITNHKLLITHVIYLDSQIIHIDSDVVCRATIDILLVISKVRGESNICLITSQINT